MRCAPQKVWLVTACALLLGACSAQPKTSVAPATTPAPPALDPSYDWHSLLVVPMGTAMRDVRFTLHEVLLFRDEKTAATPDDAECYAIEGTTPQLLQHAASEYLLCFRHDRLARIEATVALPAAQATPHFADACALWQKNAGVVVGETTAAAGAVHCEGQQAGIGYEARLDAGDPDDLLSIKLDAADAVLERR